MFDLTKLPPPSIIEPLDFEAILSRMTSDLTARDPSFSALLESDPAMKILEVAAWRELLLRQRINEAVQSNLLAFARSADLDHLGAFYDVERQDTEDDERFRDRIQAKIVGWSTAGSRDYYRYHALSADVSVKDARVISPRPGLVQIAILSTDGKPSEQLLDKVRNHICNDTIRMLTDTVQVISCTIIPLTIKAVIHLDPKTPVEILSVIKTKCTEQLKQNQGLGWSVTTSWLIAHLFAEGVRTVELLSPTVDVIVPPDACIDLVDLDVTLS